MPRIGSAGVAANVLNNSSRVRNKIYFSNFLIRYEISEYPTKRAKTYWKIFWSKSHSNPSWRRERRKSDRRRPRKIAQIVASEVETEFWRVSYHFIMKLTFFQVKISKSDLKQKKINKYFLLSENTNRIVSSKNCQSHFPKS